MRIFVAEAEQIAARIAVASEVFPIKKTEDWDARADVNAEGDVIRIVVTDHMGRARREYRAVIQRVDVNVTSSGEPEEASEK